MQHDADGRVVEIGARTRTIPPALRRALQHRDRGCRFPGCSVQVGQGHHIRHWANGGPTTLSNLALPCRRHHRAVHEDGFGLERSADGTLAFRPPDGRPLREAPASVVVCGNSRRRCGSGTRPGALACIPVRRCRRGGGNVSTSAGPSTCCKPERSPLRRTRATQIPPV